MQEGGHFLLKEVPKITATAGYLSLQGLSKAFLKLMPTLYHFYEAGNVFRCSRGVQKEKQIYVHAYKHTNTHRGFLENNFS